MELEDDPDISLSVPLKPLYEEYCCPICFNTISDGYITPCGHNFCGTCLKECLNRKHSCPYCNKDVLPANIIKNHHLDRIVAILEKEKEEASKRYFEKLINKGGLTNSQKIAQVNSSIDTTSLSPIETVFYSQMKKSLIAYQDYYQDLQKKKEKTIAEIKEKYSKTTSDLHLNKSLSKNEIDCKVNQFVAECEAQIKQIESSFTETEHLLVESFEKFLQENVCAPSFLPVQVTLTVPSKNFSLKVNVKPTDCVKDLRLLLEQKFAADPIIGFKPENVFVVKSASGKFVVNDDLRPLLQFNIQPGCEIELQGHLQLKSELPKQCFRNTFIKDATMDYFSCKECGINWICKPCVECHKGHQLVEYISNHKPTWACCYCLKSKKCKLVKQN